MAYDSMADYEAAQQQNDEDRRRLEQLDELLSNAPISGEAKEKIRSEYGRRAAEKEGRTRRDFYDYLGSEFEGVPRSEETQRRAQDLGDLRVREIDRGMFDASKGIASGYSRRGIGGSGYAAAAQSQAVQTAHAERARARAAAFDQAVAEGQRGLMGQATISGKGDPILMQLLASAEQRYRDATAALNAKNESANTAFRDLVLESAGRGAGYLMGGPAGAMAAPGTGPYDYDPEELYNYGANL